MTLNSSLRNGPALWLIALFAVGGSSSFAQRSESNVPAAIQISKDLGRADAWSEINITVHSKLSDKAAFDQAVDDLYDPASPSFHQWMTNAGLRKYAPAESQRAMVRRELENHGLTLLSTDASGFSIRAPPAPSPARSATTNLWKLAPSNHGFTSTIWPDDPGIFVLDFGFGLDSVLTVKKGWDNATG